MRESVAGEKESTRGGGGGGSRVGVGQRIEERRCKRRTKELGNKGRRGRNGLRTTHMTLKVRVFCINMVE